MSTHIDYRRPIRLLDKAVGKLWVSEASRVRWGVGIEILVDNIVAATGSQTGVFIDLKTLKPVRMPEVFTTAVDRVRAAIEAAGPANG